MPAPSTASLGSALPVPAVIVIQNSETEGANYLGYFRQVLPTLPPGLHIIHYKMFNPKHLELLPTRMSTSESEDPASYPFYCKPDDNTGSLPKTVMQPCSFDDPAVSKPFVIVGAMSFGGPMGAYEEDKHPFILKVLDTLRAVVRENIPYVGICLGAQLLARALGGRCFKHSKVEFAFVPQSVDPIASYATEEEAKRASENGIFNWFGGRKDLLAFQAHQDTFTLPGEDDPNAPPLAEGVPSPAELNPDKEVFIRIASGEFCTNQAFQIKGKRILGVQWHPDVDLPKAQHWVSLIGNFFPNPTDSTPCPPGVYTFHAIRADLEAEEKRLGGDITSSSSSSSSSPTMLQQTQALADDIFKEWLVGVAECEKEKSSGRIPMASSLEKPMLVSSADTVTQAAQ